MSPTDPARARGPVEGAVGGSAGGSVGGSALGRLSVVIANYNYAEYLGAAIDSALAVRWPDVEVVVVDDGSTDGSRAVIEGYGERVTALFTANRGQREAHNTGFAASTGDAVFFLDADDVLPPELAERTAQVWSPDITKVQLQMQRMTADGVPVGAPSPAYRRVPTSEELRAWWRATSAYPTPPGGGNVFSRRFLERVLPVGPETGAFGDSALLAAAPALGDIAVLTGVCVGYRMHDRQDSALLRDPARFAREVAVARARWRFAQRLLHGPEAPVDEAPLFRSRELLQFRVAAGRVARGAAGGMPPGEPPLPADGRRRQVLDAVRSPLWPGPEPLWHRLAVSAWCLAVLAAPRSGVRRLLALRYTR